MTLTTKLIWGAGGLLALLILLALLGLCLANAHLKTELAQARETAAACRVANLQFKTAVARQNAALDDMRAASDRRAQVAAQAVKAASVTAARFDRAASKLRKVRRRGGDCQAAAALFDRFGGAQ